MTADTNPDRAGPRAAVIPEGAWKSVMDEFHLWLWVRFGQDYGLTKPEITDLSLDVANMLRQRIEALRRQKERE